MAPCVHSKGHSNALGVPTPVLPQSRQVKCSPEMGEEYRRHKPGYNSQLSFRAHISHTFSNNRNSSFSGSNSNKTGAALAATAAASAIAASANSKGNTIKDNSNIAEIAGEEGAVARVARSAALAVARRKSHLTAPCSSSLLLEEGRPKAWRRHPCSVQATNARIPTPCFCYCY